MEVELVVLTAIVFSSLGAAGLIFGGGAIYRGIKNWKKMHMGYKVMTALLVPVTIASGLLGIGIFLMLIEADINLGFTPNPYLLYGAILAFAVGGAFILYTRRRPAEKW